MEAVDIWGVVQGDPTEIRLGMVSLSGGGGEVAEACRRETIVVAAAGGQPIEVTTSHLSLDELPEESVEGDAKNLLALPAFRAFAEELRLEGRRGIVRLRLKCVRAGDEVHVSGRALSGPSADLPASHRDATRPLPDRIDAKRIEVRLRTEGAPRPGHGVGLVQALLASPWGVSAGALAKGWVPLFLLLIFAGTGAFVSGRGLLSPHTFAWLCGAIVAGIAGCRALARAGALPPDPWADEDRPSRMPGPARLLPHVHGLERPLRRGGDYGLTLVSVGLLIIPFVLLWELINPTFGEAARPKLGALVLLFNSALLLISALGYYLADRPVRSILRGLSRALEAPRVDEGGAVAVTGTLAGTAVPLKSQLKPDREVPKTSATIEPDLPGDPTSIRFDGWCSVATLGTRRSTPGERRSAMTPAAWGGPLAGSRCTSPSKATESPRRGDCRTMRGARASCARRGRSCSSARAGRSRGSSSARSCSDTTSTSRTASWAAD